MAHEWQMIPGYRGRKTWRLFAPDTAANGTSTQRQIGLVFRYSSGWRWNATALTTSGDAMRLGDGVAKSPAGGRKAAENFLTLWEGQP